MNKFAKTADNRYFSVKEVNGDDVIAFPSGGGFQYTLKRDKVEFVDSIPNDLIPCYARFEFEPAYACIANPLERWNGWAMPIFTKEMIMKIFSEGEYFLHQKEESSGNEFWTYEKENPKHHPDDLTGLWILEWRTPGNEFYPEHLYILDGWCWDLYTENGQIIGSNGKFHEAVDSDFQKIGSH